MSASSPLPMVFVVDDDPAVRGSLKFALELDGFSVCTYADGESVIQRTAKATPRCMIVDFKLLGMSGVALIDELRQRGVNVPILLITSNPSATLQRTAAALGICIIEKPLLGNALANWVRAACATKGKDAER